jgi:hypothetical protein
MELGSLSIPTAEMKVTSIRINDSLYNIRNTNPTSEKLDISITLTQMEIGPFNAFGTYPHKH